MAEEKVVINYTGTIPYPNIDFLGRCYDFIRLDPLDLSARERDGGGGMDERAIDIPSKAVDQATTDQSILIPQGTEHHSESRGERASRAETWFSSVDMSSSLEKTVSFGFSIPGLVSFSHSKTYSEFNRTTSTNETMETFVQSYFEDCSICFKEDFQKSLSLNAKLVSAVKALTSKEQCATFIKTYGTHYAHEVTFGGRMYQRIKISTKTYRSLTESGTNVSSSAEGTYKKVTANTGASSSSSSSADLETKSGVNVEQLRWVGGTPNSNFDEWVKTVRNDPKPVQMKLRPLYELFTSVYFKDDAKIVDKRAWMETAVKEYAAKNAYIRPDPAKLANRKFYIRNRWRADVGERRVNKHLSFTKTTLSLYDETNTEDLVPWLLVPVPNRPDEFYIQNKWKESQRDGQVDKWVSFSGDIVTLCAKDDYVDRVPWKFIPVPGKQDEYYIRSRWDAEKGDKYTDYHLSFTGNEVQLYHKDNFYDLAPWKLTPA
ncbi:phospholipase [Myxococcus llanfairpwllgwyngyllgogerychwyrndrobwllllantysiliogogogochensis]|uniref:Phospholipase n=1 Tax=Myxococcus llanfairpwllgwyngyllgogerychwyrndrobwllllantysiliogogogochensis TaxID=2590453 RepID=A0A540WJM1_9BACT|nr:MAC/perforin domain-containing protein [Myxococcus llanfairpwllgwyngyllgogerychwyrndrobwllllantysiliogogogochensis]TQF09219.1 phospholipase [Myxococcus llanfairpwllgwyngyllgogerychwyrndrobwllllantysiliogogogochensis]